MAIDLDELIIRSKDVAKMASKNFWNTVKKEFPEIKEGGELSAVDTVFWNRICGKIVKGFVIENIEEQLLESDMEENNTINMNMEDEDETQSDEELVQQERIER